MRISDWSSDVCSSELLKDKADYTVPQGGLAFWIEPKKKVNWLAVSEKMMKKGVSLTVPDYYAGDPSIIGMRMGFGSLSEEDLQTGIKALSGRSEENTSELQSLMRISYAVFCLKKQKNSIKSYKKNGIQS